jgi:hypothetical protein
LKFEMVRTARIVRSLDEVDITRVADGDIFVTASDGVIYEFQERQELGGFWGFFKKIGLAVAPVAVSFIPGAGPILAPFVGAATGVIGSYGSGGSSSSSGRAKGEKATIEFGNQITIAFNELDKRVPLIKTGELTKAEVYAAAERLEAMLYDNNLIEQTTSGKAGRALTNFKNQAKERVAWAKKNADSTDAERLAILGQQQQTQQQQQQMTTATMPGANLAGSLGISTTALYAIGGGILLVLLLR